MSTGVTSPFATNLSPSSMTGPIQVARQQGLANHHEQNAKNARAPLPAGFFRRDGAPCQSPMMRRIGRRRGNDAIVRDRDDPPRDAPIDAAAPSSLLHRDRVPMAGFLAGARRRTRRMAMAGGPRRRR